MKIFNENKDTNLIYIQKLIDRLVENGLDAGKLSDGYHTFDSLYHQRLILSAMLAKNNPNAWKSKYHEDGSKPFDGTWFVMGWSTPKGEFTYHYKLDDWDMFECTELPVAKHWDGHTEEDVERLLSMR